MLGGMLLALALYFPGSHWIARAANPALVAAQARDPGRGRDRPRDLLGRSSTRSAPRKFTSACDIAKSALITQRHFLRDPSRRRRRDPGRRRRPVRSPSMRATALDSAAAQGAQGRDRRADIGAALANAGYPKSADLAAINLFVLIAVLLGFVVAATAVYGPQAAALVEMFPTRVRYTAMSLPYHVGTGWVGGFLPVTSFAIVAITGNIYSGLWYAVVFTAISAVVSLLLRQGNRGQATRLTIRSSIGRKPFAPTLNL